MHCLPVISVIERHSGKNKCGKRQFAATSSGPSDQAGGMAGGLAIRDTADWQTAR
jgi:hypothetical protein